MPYLDLLASVTDPPTSLGLEPVTLEEAKDHLGIMPEDHANDKKIARMITTAREVVENNTSRQIIQGTRTAYYRDFPRGLYWRGYPGSSYMATPRYSWWFEVPFPPLSSVTSVKYYDETGTLQTWSSSEYIVDTNYEPGRIALDPDFDWPTTEPDRINRVEVVFVAGYASPSATPARMKDYILRVLYDLFEDRGTYRAGAPLQRIRTLDSLHNAVAWGGYS